MSIKVPSSYPPAHGSDLRRQHAITFGSIRTTIALLLAIFFRSVSLCACSHWLTAGRQPVNQEGVEYYNRLIHCLLHNGITPCVTLFHWHLPQALEEEFGGFRGEQVNLHCFSLFGHRVSHWLTLKGYTFATKGYTVGLSSLLEYARLCFSLFGDRVPYWLTFNEPYTFATKGYAVGDFAPGRCSDRQCCAEGDGAVEPYVVVHHMLLAHAAAVDCYRREFQVGQVSHPSLLRLPHPIFFGTYAPAMHHYVGPPPPHKLPRLKAV
ncbi:unnamed protein product [Closterium sp. NIES-65]|nr:unnamed protein product [Closterium sp. NIES-65]